MPNETVANLSHLPSDLISVIRLRMTRRLQVGPLQTGTLIRRSLAGEAFVPASAAEAATTIVVVWR